MQNIPPVRNLRILRWLPAFLAAAFLFGPLAVLGQARTDFSLIEQYGNSTLDDLNGDIKTPSSDPNSSYAKTETGHVAMCAYLSLCLRGSTTGVAEAQYDLDQIIQAQQSMGDGSFPWTLGNTAPQNNSNAITFTSKALVFIYKQYGAALGSTYQTKLKTCITNAIQPTIAQMPAGGVDYTNIYTMQFVNELLMGEIANDSNSVNKGLEGLDTFIEHTRAVGMFHEYDSPTYAETTYTNFLGGYLYTTNTAAKTKLRALLDYAATDLAANYLVGTMNLVGSHSREYDFPAGRGAVQNFYYLESFDNELSSETYTDAYFEYVTVKNGGYTPSASIQAIPAAQATTPLVVKQTYGLNSDGSSSGEDRYTYLTAGYSLGSTSNDYYRTSNDKYDKQITASLTPPAGVDPLTTMETTVVYDSRDLPYGEKLAGQSKQVHLYNVCATVQEKGMVFSLSDLANMDTSAYTTISSNIIFPLHVDSLLYTDGANGGAVTAKSNPYTVHVDTASVKTDIDAGTVDSAVVGIRTGKNMVAFRMFLVDGINGATPDHAKIKFDGGAGTDDGDARGMGRLVVYGYNNTNNTIPFTTTTMARTGLIMVTTTLPTATDSDATTFLNALKSASLGTSTVTSGVWTDSAAFTDPFTSVTTTLAAKLDLNTSTHFTSQKGKSVLSRTVNGTAFAPDRFTVTQLTSGSPSTTNYAAQILDPVTTGAADLAASPGNGQVTLTWSAVPGADTYNVKRATTRGGPYAAVSGGTAISSPGFTDTGLTNTTTYYYVVTANKSTGEGGNSNEASAMPVPAPAAPASPSAVATDGSIRVSWASSLYASNYVVYRSTSSGGTYQKANGGPITTTNWTDNGVTNGTTYYYQITAVGPGGTSGYSNIVSATPQVIAPTNLAVVPSDSSCRLTWSASTSTGVNYLVYRSTSSGGTYQKVNGGPITTTNWTDNSVTNGTTYYYKVTAVNGPSTSDYSNTAYATPQVAPPTNASAVAGSKSVRVSWTLSTSPGVNYLVYRSTSSGGTYQQANVGNITTNNWTDNGRTAGTTYYYKVTAVNGPSTSDYSNITYATPTP